ncbi:MAG: biopolymer transporter ExbD [Proteobacteria bacterium]|nr:biopolymer transporter ExbD [Pseudomonadota bacterium]MBU4295971.1 biopolymer transporter ExbD [Pseudomonadota bacterium]MCG2747997.1 biopolymer transporter ExbD [Desulfobulbaceae bacterium]
MIVHPKRRDRFQVQVPLTSLIDMVFLLLIYFLLTTNYMVVEGIAVKLPKANAAASQSDEMITVAVSPDGRFFIGDNEFTEEALTKQLQELLAASSNRLVVVKADRTVQLDRAVIALDLAKAAGAERLSLATEKDF